MKQFRKIENDISKYFAKVFSLGAQDRLATARILCQTDKKIKPFQIIHSST